MSAAGVHMRPLNTVMVCDNSSVCGCTTADTMPTDLN